AGEDKTVRVWDVEKGRQVAALRGHQGKVLKVAPAPDGRHAASGTDRGELIVWDLSSGEARRRWQGHSGSINGIAYTREGDGLITCSSKPPKLGHSTLRWWNPKTGKEVDRRESGHGPFFGVAVSADDRYAVASAYSPGYGVGLWDMKSRKL